jgi:hypothetical protein
MVLFYIVGMVFATLGFFMYLDAYFFRKKARSVDGSVIGYETSRSKNGHYYHPVVQYSDQGNTYRFKADIGSNVMSYVISAICFRSRCFDASCRYIHIAAIFKGV